MCQCTIYKTEVAKLKARVPSTNKPNMGSLHGNSFPAVHIILFTLQNSVCLRRGRGLEERNQRHPDSVWQIPAGCWPTSLWTQEVWWPWTTCPLPEVLPLDAGLPCHHLGLYGAQTVSVNNTGPSLSKVTTKTTCTDCAVINVTGGKICLCSLWWDVDTVDSLWEGKQDWVITPDPYCNLWTSSTSRGHFGGHYPSLAKLLFYGPKFATWRPQSRFIHCHALPMTLQICLCI